MRRALYRALRSGLELRGRIDEVMDALHPIPNCVQYHITPDRTAQPKTYPIIKGIKGVSEYRLTADGVVGRARTGVGEWEPLDFDDIKHTRKTGDTKSAAQNEGDQPMATPTPTPSAHPPPLIATLPPLPPTPQPPLRGGAADAGAVGAAPQQLPPLPPLPPPPPQQQLLTAAAASSSRGSSSSSSSSSSNSEQQRLGAGAGAAVPCADAERNRPTLLWPTEVHRTLRGPHNTRSGTFESRAVKRERKEKAKAAKQAAGERDGRQASSAAVRKRRRSRSRTNSGAECSRDIDCASNRYKPSACVPEGADT
jgi:hypothetical protein